MERSGSKKDMASRVNCHHTSPILPKFHMDLVTLTYGCSQRQLVSYEIKDI